MSNYFNPPTFMNDDRADEEAIRRIGELGREGLDWEQMILDLAGSPPNILVREFQVVSTLNHENTFVRVFSWNVLSQALGESVDNFRNKGPVSDWSKRRVMLLQEIMQYHPDVICLQEVDHYRFLDAFLSCHGYRGEFYAKPRSPCLSVQNNNGPDGVALFFSTIKFEWVTWHDRPIQALGLPTNQVALGAILKLRSNQLQMFFAVTHFKARSSPIMAKLREYQGECILRWLEEKAQDRPVVLCGDFNAEPREGAYNKLINHPFCLKSAYRIDAQEPEFTTWKIRNTGEEKKTVDYIFYSSKLLASQIVQLPEARHVSEDRFPNDTYPSDHIALVADLKVNPNHVMKLD